jgi:hypothetical protein
MDPATIATGWTIAKTAGEISKKLYDFGKSLKDRDAKQKIDEILDQVRELKQSASELEDENRQLRDDLRFKAGEYEFRNPFWYYKTNPSAAFCPKCFAKNIASPMGEAGQECASNYRRCLVCANSFEVERGRGI